jgi:predicted MFS family arabinose efflux permease
MITLSVDIYLPAIPEIKNYFQASEQATQMSFGLGFIASSLGGIIFGPLSDRIGRRPVLIGTALITLLGCILCAFSTSIEMFNFSRFFQCVGIGGSWVLSYAILAEAYDEKKNALMVSYMGTLQTMIYVIAPNLGGFVTAYLGWQWCFLVVVVGLLPLTALSFQFFPETLQEKNHHTMTQTYVQLVHIAANPYFVSLGLVLSLVIGGLLLPFSSLPSIFRQLGIGETVFGIFLGAIPIAETLTTFATRSLIKKYGLDFVLKCGLVFAVLGGIFFFGVVLLTPSNPYLIMLALSVFSMALPMLFPPVISRCLSVFPDQKGTAAALLSSLRYLVIGLCAYLGSIVYDDTLVPAAICMMIISAFAVIMWRISQYYTAH